MALKPKQQQPPVVGFIGDSITAGGIPVTTARDRLTTLFGETVKVINRGASGRTTRSWLPLPNGEIDPVTKVHLLSAAEKQFVDDNVTVVSIMLGTNDAKSTEMITAEMYRENLNKIISHLFKAIPTLKMVVLNKTITPNPKYKGNYASLEDSATSGNTRVKEYHTVIQALIDQGQGIIVQGDTSMYDYFYAAFRRARRFNSSPSRRSDPSW